MRQRRRLPLSVAAVILACAPALAQSASTQDAQAVVASELPIHVAARTGTRAEVERLLTADRKLRDLSTDYGSTPLHLAAMNPDTGPLQALLAAGAPVHARDREGATPLHMAAYGSNTRAAVLLLEAGADPRLKTSIGRDVLSMARKVQANELAGVVSLWLLKNCKPGVPC